MLYQCGAFVHLYKQTSIRTPDARLFAIRSIVPLEFFCHEAAFFASALDHFAVAEEKGDAPQAGGANQGVDDAAEHGCLAAKDRGDQIELEDADQPPVDGADDDQKQCNFVQNQEKHLLAFMR